MPSGPNPHAAAAQSTRADVDAAWARLVASELSGRGSVDGVPVGWVDASGEVHDTGIDDGLGRAGREDVFAGDSSGLMAVDGSTRGWFGELDGDNVDCGADGRGDSHPGREADPLSGSGGSVFAGMVPGVRLAAMLDAYGPAQLDVHEVADSVAAWERIVAWAQAKQATAAAELTRRPELRPDDGSGCFGSLHPVPVAAGALCAVRPWTRPQAEKLVDHAITLVEECPNVYRALSEGRLDAAKARILTRALSKCESEVAKLIEKAVLPFVHSWTEVKLSRVVNELLHELDAAGAKRRRREARSRRDVRVEPGEDGMAWLIAYLPAEEAAAIMAALNAAADSERGRTCSGSATCHNAGR